MTAIVLDAPLAWRDVAAVADGARLVLSEPARARIATARAIVEALVETGVRTYGVTTGVGALSEVVVDRAQQSRLSHNLLMSHAVGVGAPLPAVEARAIVAAQVNNFALGHSGVRPEVADALLALLDANCLPEVPRGGSVGYLTHMAHIALVLVGAGHATLAGERLTGAAALARIGRAPLVLAAKEGLSLINGTPCATGLAAVALARAARVLDWADAAAAMSFEALMGEPAAYDAESLALRPSPGLLAVGERLRALLAGSPMLAGPRRRTQDAISLRAVPHVHGAARDAFDAVAATVDRELSSVTDNPAVAGTPDDPRVFSEAHAMGAALALAMDHLAAAVATVAAMSERRLDRLINPMVSGLPAFLAAGGGVSSGFMIAQYTAVSLVAENRRLALPASLDGGITSALQEDHLVHATPAALKALDIVANAEAILAIELLAAAQAYDARATLGAMPGRAAGTERLYRAVRAVAAAYADDRPLSDDMAAAAALIRRTAPETRTTP